jgi:hypothetical protein
MSDSAQIDVALLARLNADSALLAVAKDGVFVDMAPEDATRFVIVSLLDEFDEGMFGGRAFEDALYLVKAVFRQINSEAVGAALATAANRIDALLEDQPLTASGYTWMTTHREERVRWRSKWTTSIPRSAGTIAAGTTGCK